MRYNVFLLSAAVLAAAVPAQATIVLDQDNLMAIAPESGIYSSLIGTSADLWQGQVVQAGKSGLLARVDLQVRHRPVTYGPLTLEIVSLPLPTTPGTGVEIAASSISTSFDGDIVSVDVSSLGFTVTAGTSFGLLLRSAAVGATNAYGWLYGEVDSNGDLIYSRDYAAGVNSIFDLDLPPLYNIGAWGATTYDRGFATYVDVVPEPASWALMIAGFGLVGGALRRRTMVAA